MLPAAPRLGIPAAPQWFGDTLYEAAWLASLEQLREMGAELVELDFSPMQQLAELLYGGPWVAERYAAVAGFILTWVPPRWLLARFTRCGTETGASW